MSEPTRGSTVSILNYTADLLVFSAGSLRGLVKDITDLEAYINVKAVLRYLLSIGDIHARSGVVVAGDVQPSTDRIMRACAQAVVDSDCQVENEGAWSRKPGSDCLTPSPASMSCAASEHTHTSWPGRPTAGFWPAAKSY